MRQRDPRERRALARLHGGAPSEYLELKRGRHELIVYGGKQAGLDAEREAVAQWASARHDCGAQKAVLVCRDNQRRDRLNQLAREHLAQIGELTDPVELGGREWAVGDRVIARRNDRGRDLDNGMRATAIAVDEQRGLTVEVDTGQIRQLDVEYVSAHVEHAYALTGHGMQGGTVEWAGVVGQAEDFTRNWSYTALSRARQPTQIFLIDEPTRSEQARAEIAAQGQPREQSPLQRLVVRMRQRDDEDLALEQLEHIDAGDSGAALELTAGASALPESRLAICTDPAAEVPATAGLLGAELATEQQAALTQLAAVRAELADLRERLADPRVQAAQEISSGREIMEAICAEAVRDRRPTGWRVRAAHRSRAAVRGRQLAELVDREQRLLEQVPDPEAVLEQAGRDHHRQRQLIQIDGDLNRRAVDQELESRPAWLDATLGHEPDQEGQRQRWQRTARELASHRIEHHIIDPNDPGARPGDHALQRAISDTRAALGLDLPAPGDGRERSID